MEAHQSYVPELPEGRGRHLGRQQEHLRAALQLERRHQLHRTLSDRFGRVMAANADVAVVQSGTGGGGNPGERFLLV